MNAPDNRGRLHDLAAEVYIRRASGTALYRIHCSTDGGAALVSRDDGKTFDIAVDPGNSVDVEGTSLKVKPKDPARPCSITFDLVTGR